MMRWTWPKVRCPALIFSLLLTLLSAQDDVSEHDDISEDEAGLDVGSLALQHAMHGPQHVEQWDSFLTRALNRGRNRDIPLSEQERLPSSDDHLWEIGCAVSGPLDVKATGFDTLCR